MRIFILIWLLAGLTSFRSNACDMLSEQYFYEAQAEALEKFDLSSDLIVATGGSSTVYFTRLPHDFITASGATLTKGSSALVKLPLTRTEAILIKNEFSIIKKLQQTPTDAIVDAAFDGSGALIMPYRADRLRTLSHYAESSSRNPLPPLTVPQLNAVKSQLFSILSQLQLYGIVHSDIKPQNILVAVNASGEISLQLIDFGIACPKGAYPQKGLRERGGTPEFASPEQLNDHPASFRDDTYAVARVIDFLEANLAP